MLTTHGVAEGEWDGQEWVQYRWSCKVKDSDVLYWIHLEDLTQLEKEGQSLQQEQSEVDLEKELEEEIARYLREECSADDEPSISDIARHFAEWGATHLKK